MRNLVLIEEFQSFIPIDISDRGEEDVHKAAVLAEDFAVTRQAIGNQVETKSNRDVTRNTEQAQAIAMPDKTVKTTNESKPKLTLLLLQERRTFTSRLFETEGEE